LIVLSLLPPIEAYFDRRFGREDDPGRTEN
jgi:hypothetical protein